RGSSGRLRTRSAPVACARTPTSSRSTSTPEPSGPRKLNGGAGHEPLRRCFFRPARRESGLLGRPTLAAMGRRRSRAALHARGCYIEILLHVLFGFAGGDRILDLLARDGRPRHPFVRCRRRRADEHRGRRGSHHHHTDPLHLSSPPFRSAPVSVVSARSVSRASGG